MQEQVAVADPSLNDAKAALVTALRRYRHRPEQSELSAWLAVARHQLEPTQADAVRATLHEAFEAVRAECGDGVTILEKRYLEDLDFQTIGRQIGYSDPSVSRKQADALAAMAAWLLAVEAAERQQLRAAQLAHLETPTYLRLFGAEVASAEVTGLLQQPGPPWIISIGGMGGLGKTALADYVVRQVVRNGKLEGVAWITARRERLNPGGTLRASDGATVTVDTLWDLLAAQVLSDLPAETHWSDAKRREMVLQRLRNAEHLVVIDNVETVVEVEPVLDLLRQLVNPSRILLTTRTNLFQEGDIYHYVLPPIQAGSALELIRHEAAIRNLPAVAAAGDAELHPIFEAVGGNPLALRLVVGQLHLHPLDAILADLSEVRLQPVEGLYTFIYQRGWAQLDEITRAVFLTMPLSPEEGAEPAHLAELGGFTDTDLQRALSHLVTLNLVDRRDGFGLHRTRYSIHSLTRRFLHRHVLRW